MKLQIEFTKNTEPVPFNYVSKINGYLHKVLGENNEYHDKISIYSTSFLHGNKRGEIKKYLNFNDGAIWYVSSPDIQFLNSFIRGVYNNVDFIYGMVLKEIKIVDYVLKEVNGRYVFKTKSPILIKQKNYVTKENIYYTANDEPEITSKLLKNIILKKANDFKFNIDPNDFDISFNQECNFKKIKWIKIGEINNKTSACSVIVNTNKPEIAKFIYEVGAGNSTGSCLGFLL